MTDYKKDRDNRGEPRRGYQGKKDKNPETYVKKETKSPKVDWVETYLVDMGNQPAPADWVSLAQYHLEGISKEVTEIVVLDWNPTHVDVENRMIDESVLWCSALVDGQPYGIILHLGPEVKYEALPGKAKELKAPF